MILIFNYNDYLRNPVAAYCVKQLPNPTILTWKDIEPDVMKLHHPQEVMTSINKKTRWSFLGDELRLYYSLQYDNYLYCDADVFLPESVQKEIWKNKNCVAWDPSDNQINNGTFFCSDRDCKFNEYYFNLYETSDLTSVTNTNVYKKFPYHVNFDKKIAGDMNLLSVPYRHFALSKMDDFKRRYERDPSDIVYYTFTAGNKSLINKGHRIFWQLNSEYKNNTSYKFINNQFIFQWDIVDYVKYIPLEENLDLWKEQVCYTLGRTVKFEEV